ncbi:ATP-binding domain-containing protein [Acetobacter okinawensis]|uniref:ATP-binding domain-containing protein n=1 Tax=Acetobacter okinawensis TaxID=1076594 RepID=UPI001BAD30AF|nr:ATP-binding domain-containing protein [Acetobacter okinawensis]MBS0989443.1 ATP-binding domain-containing protein [Acetobacter okinawensis]
MQTWWRGDNELDDDQKAIMELAVDGSFAVTGPPGSGKTNLLLMRGAYLALQSRNFAIVVMNRTLAEFIRSGASEYQVPRDAVMTSHQFIGRLAAEAGIPLTSGLTWEAGRAERLAVLKSINAAKGRPIYDAILIDEAQDHNEAELTELRKLARDVFLTADARQLIYTDGCRDPSFYGLVSVCKTLRWHYRSAREICDLADAIGDQFTQGYTRIAPTCRYPNISPKGEITIAQAPIQQQAEMIAERLDRQLRVYRGELIGVFAPNRREALEIASLLETLGYADRMTKQVGDEGYMEIDQARPICVSTVHGAKGLEFRAVHFVAAETVLSHRGNQKRLAFTGVTRAKTSLTIYHEKSLPRFFEAAVAPWRPKKKSSDWRSVFNAG